MRQPAASKGSNSSRDKDFRRGDSLEQRNSVSNEIDLPPVMGQEPPVSDIAKRKPADHPE